MIDTVYMDCDGVLFDFTGAALRAFGVPEAEWDLLKRGEYSIAKCIGQTEEAFWERIDTPEFWGGVRLYQGAVEFMMRLKWDRRVGVVYCTSSSHNVPAFVTARFAALSLLDRLSEYYDVPRRGIVPTFYCSGIGKAGMAREGALLVDDMAKNCETFRAAGGRAIMPRMPWNTVRGKASYDGPDYDKLLKEIMKEVRK